MTQRFVTSALMAAVVLAGCSKNDKDKAPPAEPGSGSAMATPPTPPPTPPPAGSGSAAPAGSGSAAAPAGDTAAPSGTPAKLADMLKLTLPSPPPKAPAGGNWVSAGEVETDGYRQGMYVAADKTNWYSYMVIDCRLQKVKDDGAKKPGDRGPEALWCLKKADGKIKDNDRLTDPDSLSHGVRAGNLVVVVGPTPNVKDKVNDADVDAFLGSLDLAAIAKL